MPKDVKVLSSLQGVVDKNVQIWTRSTNDSKRERSLFVISKNATFDDRISTCQKIIHDSTVRIARHSPRDRLRQNEKKMPSEEEGIVD